MNLLSFAPLPQHTIPQGYIKPIQLRDCPILEHKESPIILNPYAIIAGLTSLLGSFTHNVQQPFEIRKYVVQQYNFLSQVA